MQQIHMHKIKQLVGRHYQWVLIASMLPLFATKTLFNLPLLIMTLLGLIMLFRDFGRLRRDEHIRFMLLLFLCFWVPIVGSLPDAVNAGRGISTALRYIAYPLAGLFIITALADSWNRKRVYQASIFIILFWCVDGLVQYYLGYDVLGYPSDNARLSGIFYPNFRIGTVTAVVMPLILDFIRRHTATRPWIWVFFVVAVMVITLSGSRSAWLMFLLSMLLYLVYLFATVKRKMLLVWLLIPVLLVPAAVILTKQSKPDASSVDVQARIEQTKGLFKGDLASLDKATSYRLTFWLVASRIYTTHWVNGIGPRGYREVYKSFEKQKYPWPIRISPGATHPHMMVLEVAAETGSAGLAGYLLFYVLLILLVRRNRKNITAAVPWLMAAAVAVFPLNVHMALYGSYWGTIAFWLLFVALGMMQKARDESVRA
jgi:O-antigen ligase